MGNCGNKPLTKEGEGPAPEQKGVELDETSREIEMDHNKVTAHAHHPTKPPSLAQMLEDKIETNRSGLRVLKKIL
ncbi:unnamed protein product [Amaranthus hypochondriacus]